jgi:hypothetical protein
MRSSRAGMLLVIFVAQLLAPILAVWAQTSPPLKNRIPKPDPKKYESIRDGKDWHNPQMFVRPDGIEIIGMTPAGRGIPAESIPDKLEHLPDSAWPYGLVVAVSDIGIVSSRRDAPRINENRTKLLKKLKGHGIAVVLWPSA